ncbi:hypothetical protein [Methylobacterium tardum]|nr:hypothetical protein [Methylobacterium tardum]
MRRALSLGAGLDVPWIRAVRLSLRCSGLMARIRAVDGALTLGALRG